MTFKLSSFRVGDLVEPRLVDIDRTDGNAGFGTVLHIGSRELHVSMHRYHFPYQYWRLKPWNIIRIIEAADGPRGERAAHDR